MGGKDRRQEPRFHVCNETHFEVALQQRTCSDAIKTVGVLRDLSEGGAQFVVSTPLLVREALAVTFKSEQIGIALAISGEVCWTRPEGQDLWTLGCSFTPRLPHEILEKFFQAQVVERRTARRKPRRLPIMVRWDDEEPVLPAYLWDVSLGGFSMLSTRVAGENVAIETERLRRQYNLRARAQWQATVSGGFMIGCRFATANAFETFERLYGEKPSLKKRIKGLFSRGTASAIEDPAIAETVED
jgi:hypothetical protein